jgi:hypothetical protein
MIDTEGRAMTPDDERELFRRLARIDQSLRVLAVTAPMAAGAFIALFVDKLIGRSWGGWASLIFSVVLVGAFAFYLNRHAQD